IRYGWTVVVRWLWIDRSAHQIPEDHVANTEVQGVASNRRGHPGIGGNLDAYTTVEAGLRGIGKRARRDVWTVATGRYTAEVQVCGNDVDRYCHRALPIRYG